MKEVPQLQAADIIAYEFNKRAVNEISPDENYIRKSLDNLDFEGNCTPLYYGVGQVISIMEDMKHLFDVEEIKKRLNYEEKS